MKVRFFGRLRDQVGVVLDVAIPGHIVDSQQLRAWLGRDYPALLDPSVKIALDDRLLVAPAPLDGVDEVAFLPPVSGG